jgi:ABC transporter
MFVDHAPCPRRVLFELTAATLTAGGAPLLHDVRVAVRPGDRIRIAGDNGAGKSTLLRALLASHRLPDDRLLVLPQELDPGGPAALLAEVRGLAPAVRGRVLSLGCTATSWRVAGGQVDTAVRHDSPLGSWERTGTPPFRYSVPMNGLR